MQKLIKLAALAIAALYLTVWPHEVGHALAAYLLGCKGDWWRTYTTWYLAGSGPGAIRLQCLVARGPGSMAVVAGAGIAANLLLLGAAILAARWASGPARISATADRWRAALLLPAVVLALTEAAEAFSYLLLNGVFPRADLALLISTTGQGGWLWAAAGLALCIPAALALREPLEAAAVELAAPGNPGPWRRRLVAATLALTLFIGGYRVVAHPAPTPGMAGFQS